MNSQELKRLKVGDKVMLQRRVGSKIWWAGEVTDIVNELYVYVKLHYVHPDSEAEDGKVGNVIEKFGYWGLKRCNDHLWSELTSPNLQAL